MGRRRRTVASQETCPVPVHEEAFEVKAGERCADSPTCLFGRLGFFYAQNCTAETAESAEKKQVKVKVKVKKGGVGWSQRQSQSFPLFEVLCELCELRVKTIAVKQ